MTYHVEKSVYSEIPILADHKIEITPMYTYIMYTMYTYIGTRPADRITGRVPALFSRTKRRQNEAIELLIIKSRHQIKKPLSITSRHQ